MKKVTTTEELMVCLFGDAETQKKSVEFCKVQGITDQMARRACIKSLYCARIKSGDIKLAEAVLELGKKRGVEFTADELWEMQNYK